MGYKVLLQGSLRIFRAYRIKGRGRGVFRSCYGLRLLSELDSLSKRTEDPELASACCPQACCTRLRIQGPTGTSQTSARDSRTWHVVEVVPAMPSGDPPVGVFRLRSL